MPAPVEDDRPALRDCKGARRDHAIRLIERARIQRGIVAQRLELIDPVVGYAVRDSDPAHAAVVEDRTHSVVELARWDPVRRGLVVMEAVDELLDAVVGSGAVVARDLLRR